MNSVRRQSSGFTLVELVITVAILAILMAIAAPSFRSLILSQRVKTASFDLFSAITYARSEAIKLNANIELRAGESVDGAWATGWRVVDGAGNILRRWGPVSNLSLVDEANPSASPALLTFGVSGRLTSPPTSPRFEIASSPAASGVSPRCVQVDLSGRATTRTEACP
jgi:type IV fimbrial biogenesis protein FimT